MATPDDILRAIRLFLESEFESAAVLAPGRETPLFKGGLELDSFAIVEVISHLESTFDFEFREADFREEHFKTVGTLADLVKRYVG